MPVYAQLASELERRILAGELAVGTRLPAEREMAQSLAINRGTVSRAYRELEARDLVAGRVGSGTTVLARPASAAAPAPLPLAPRLSRGIRDLAAAVGVPAAAPAADAIDFQLMLPDVALFPRDRLVKAVNRALERGDEVLQYGSPAGFLPLRQRIAERLCGRGIEVGAEQVLVVNGAQQALDLVAKVALDPGDAVLVESPTYAAVLPLLRLYGARIEGVALDREGLDPAALDRAMQAHRPRLLYTIPSFQNPTGATMSRERRQAVLAAARRHRVLVVEDGYEEDLRYAGEELPPLAALDPSGGVVYLGTFSKGLFPGLRLGFIVARGETAEMLALAKRYSDYHADLLAQAVLAEILHSGDYDAHLERLRETYGERLAQALAALRRHLPEGVRFREPEGGYIVWIELPAGVSAAAVAAAAGRRGVAVLAGHPFYTAPAEGDRALRLSISRTPPGRIEEGIIVLGEVIAAAIGNDPRPSRHSEAPALV